MSFRKPMDKLENLQIKSQKLQAEYTALKKNLQEQSELFKKYLKEDDKTHPGLYTPAGVTLSGISRYTN